MVGCLAVVTPAEKSRPARPPRRWVVAIALACAVLLPSPRGLLAVCLGCPPVAWKARVHLDDGGEIVGYLELPGVLVEERVDLGGGELPGYWKDREAEPLRLWRRAVAFHHVYDGRCHTASGDAAATEPVPCEFSLPPGHLFLVGEPETIPLEQVTRIDDASCLEGCIETRRALRLGEEDARRMVAPPRIALEERVGNDGAVTYCFAFAADVGVEDLVALCRHHPSYEEPPPVPPGVVRIFDDPGT